MISLNLLRRGNLSRLLECAPAFTATLGIGVLVVVDGRLPSPFSALFFIPIILTAYQYPLSFSLVIAGLASLFSSPAMVTVDVEASDWVTPVLWLGWPAVYLFLAVSLNEWANIRQQRQQLEATKDSLLDVGARNEKRRQELETLSSIHAAVLSGGDEASVMEEVARRVAEVTGATVCSIVTPTSANRERPLCGAGFSEELFNRVFPQGAPYGEGVAGWAMLHRRAAASKNVFQDPRYDRLREFARAVNFVSAAAAPVELDQDLYGALVICYGDEREFTPEEMARLERLAQQTELAICSVRQRESLSRFAFDTALVLSEAIESRDPYTGGHCRRLSEHAVMAGQQLALSSREIEVIRLGAALHDMGKIVVPDSILKKPDRLTPEEYAIVKQHCYSGGQICKRVKFLMDAYPVVYHHHERWDGNGYPDGLKEEHIPISARIVAVVDAYDAMTADRPYRRALSHLESVEILKDGAGHQWDPEVVRIFLELLRTGNGSAPMAGLG